MTARQKTVLYIEDEQELAEEIIDLLDTAGIKAVNSPEYGDAVSKSMNQDMPMSME